MWAPHLQPYMRPIGYDRLNLLKPLPPGAYLFTDFERALPVERRFIQTLHARMQAHRDGYRLINDPHRWVDRFTLINRLADAGLADYRAYRLNEIDDRVRFPIFIRRDNDHGGPRSPLLHSPDELRRYMRRGRLLRDRVRSRRLMAVEYSDAGQCEEGYRKYAAMKIGEAILPRHLLHGRQWMVKYAATENDERAAQHAASEAAFIDAFAHGEALRAVFEIAGVDYGRVDYAVKDGRICVWEVNTNPNIAIDPRKVAPPRMESQQRVLRAIAAAFEQLIGEQRDDGEGVVLFTKGEARKWRAYCAVMRGYDLVRR